MIELIMKYIAYGYVGFGVCFVTFCLIYNAICLVADIKERKRK